MSQLQSALIALVGMPGCGKSTIGRQLARRISVPFTDTDAAIESRIHESIRSFFEREGEDEFRNVEQDMISELTLSGSGVLATGGGAVLRDANRRCLRDRCTVVYLRSTPEELARRLKHDTDRPLLQGGNVLGRLRGLYAERDPLYRQTAHFVVDTGRPAIQTLVNLILMQLELTGIIGTAEHKAPPTHACDDKES